MNDVAANIGEIVSSHEAMASTGRGLNRDDREDTQETSQLVSKVQSGSISAFEPLVRRSERRLRAYCAAMLGNRELGEDAAQEVFVRAYQRIGTYRGDSSFERWILVLARNYCVDQLRKRKQDPIPLAAPIDDGETTTKGRALHDAESFDLLCKLYGALPPNYREVLLLRELYGLDYGELAKVLSLSLDGVKGQLRRARVQAEEILRKLERIKE